MIPFLPSRRLPALLLPCLLATFPATASELPGRAALTMIGEVNGTALACQQLAIVSRARNAVATTAPKTREHGEVFEHATQTAFLALGQGGACPEAAVLTERLQTAEEALARAFARQP